MNFFSAIRRKISLMLEKGHSPIVLHGIKTDEWPIFFEMQFKNDEANKANEIKANPALKYFQKK